MKDNLNFDEIISELSKSPIRKILKENEITIFEEERVVLEDIENIIKANKKNCEMDLKVVILGEVKAGKSTLINSLVGRKVSYTNVVEATATILEVAYGESLMAKINYVDGSEKVFDTLEDLDNELYGKEENQEFFDKIGNLKISTPTMKLKNLTIVDTPGLNTITTENAKRTGKYIENADVILWVLNGHHLGQSDVSEKINEVLEYGKPIIAVINRLDEIDGDEEELIEYVSDEMGYMFEEIFAISAKNAWDGSIYKDKEKYEDSNIEKVIDYIYNNFELNSKEAQANSIDISNKLQIEKDLRIHERAVFRITEISKEIDSKRNEIKEINRNIKNIVENKLDNWIENEFFAEQRRILENISSDSEFSKSVAKFTTGSYINNLISVQYEELADYISNEWKNNSEKIIEEQKEELNSAQQYSEVVFSDDSTENGGNGMVEGAKKGAVAGGAVGLGLAGYAAWLGPAAAYVTTGAALTAILPPVLIAGAIGGAIWKFSNADNNKKDRIGKLDTVVCEMRQSLKANVIKEIKKNLFSMSDSYEKKSKDLVENVIIQCNTSMEELESIKKELNQYIK